MEEKIISSFKTFFNNVIEALPGVIIGLIFLTLFIAIGVLLRNFTKRQLLRNVDDILLVNFIGRLVFLLTCVLGVVIFLNQLGLGKAANGLLAGAGVSAIVLGFAFRDIGENFLAGFFLAIGRPFSIGDVIEVEKNNGIVKALSFRNTHIRTFDGRDIFIPNAMVVKSPLTNFTKDGLMRHDFIIGLDYGVDIADAIRTILTSIKELENIVRSDDLQPFVTIHDFGTSTVNLKIHFWFNTMDMLRSYTTLKSTVMHHVFLALVAKGFNMPADIIELKIYQEGNPIPVAITASDLEKKSTTNS